MWGHIQVATLPLHGFERSACKHVNRVHTRVCMCVYMCMHAFVCVSVDVIGCISVHCADM